MWTDVDVNDIYELEMADGSQVHDYLCEQVYETPKDKLDVLVKFFIELFRDERIAQSSQLEKVVYRGIVGFTVEDKAVLLKPTKSFTSTSTDLKVAMIHTGFMESRMNNDTDKRVILEMHLAPGIKYVDYNSLIPGDTTNEWQKEFILPPGLHFVEKEIKHVKRTEEITVRPSTSVKKPTKHEETPTQIIETEYDILVVEVRAQSFTGGGKRHKKVTSSKR
jgi:hypothetical protein